MFKFLKRAQAQHLLMLAGMGEGAGTGKGRRGKTSGEQWEE